MISHSNENALNASSRVRVEKALTHRATAYGLYSVHTHTYTIDAYWMVLHVETGEKCRINGCKNAFGLYLIRLFSSFRWY